MDIFKSLTAKIPWKTLPLLMRNTTETWFWARFLLIARETAEINIEYAKGSSRTCKAYNGLAIKPFDLTGGDCYLQGQEHTLEAVQEGWDLKVHCGAWGILVKTKTQAECGRKP